MKTRFAIVPATGKVVVEPGSVDEPGEGQLLLRAAYSTISPGTERSLMAGQILPLPQNIGYSMAARVEAAGPGVAGFRPGDAVVATARHADYLLIDQRAATPVAEGTDLEQAAFFNLAHTALYAIRRTGIQLGEPAVVMGQGLVGAITACLARLAGALPVIVTDIDETRLALARKLGADLAINTQSEPTALAGALRDLGRDGFPVVFEATGLRAPLEQAVEIVGERGRVMMMSTSHEPASPEFTRDLMMKGATLIGGYINSKPFALSRSDIVITDAWPPAFAAEAGRYAGSDVWTSDEDIRVILELIRRGRLDLRPLISHRFTVAQIPEAYDRVWDRDPELLGGVIDWNA